MHLTRDIRRLTSDDYEHAIESYISKCANISEVAAIYQFGNVGAPGLSDIDLLVVLGEDVERTEDLQLLSIAHPFWQCEPLIRDCFIHDVLVCPSSVFRDIDWIVPGNEWRHLAGSRVDRREPSSDESDVISLVHGLDFAIARLHELVRVAHRPSCSSRWLVPQLWSVTHTYRTLACLGAPVAPSWHRLLDALTNLRKTPAEQVSEADLAALLPRVTAHFESAIDGFAHLLMDLGHVSVPRVARSYGLASYSIRALNVYPAAGEGPARTSAGMVKRRLTLMGRTLEAAWSRVELPSTILGHHLAYLLVGPGDLRLARRMARQAKVEGSHVTTSTYERVLKKRRELVRRTNEMLEMQSIAFTHMTIPGLLTHVPASTPNASTWRQRLLMSWLDWRALPGRTVAVESA